MRSLERAKSHEETCDADGLKPKEQQQRGFHSSSVVFTSASFFFSLSLVLDHGNFNLIGNQVGGSSSLGLSAMPKKHCFTVFGIQVSNVPIF